MAYNTQRRIADQTNTEKNRGFIVRGFVFFLSVSFVTSIITSVVCRSLSREPLPVLHRPMCGQEPTL